MIHIKSFINDYRIINPKRLGNSQNKRIKNQKNTITMTDYFHKFSFLLFFNYCALLLIIELK